MKPFSLDDSTHYYKNTTLFCATLMGSAFAGLVLGALVEQLVKKVQGSRNSKLQSAFFLILHLSIITILLCIGVRIYPHFGTWLQVTLAGLMFALTFFTVQAQLTQNTLNLFA